MSQAGKRTRRHFTPKEKVAILKRHLVDEVPVSDLCDELNLQPRLFYRWQQEFFEKGAAAFASDRNRDGGRQERRIAQLESKLQLKNEVLSELMEEHVQLKKKHRWGALTGRWVPHDTRDHVVDFVSLWTRRTEIAPSRFVSWLGICSSKWYEWRRRYGRINEHNAWIPRDFWLQEWEKEAILAYHDEHRSEGYRRLSFMMLDADIVAVSPTTVYRVLTEAGCLRRWNTAPSLKGRGFTPPGAPHEHWHIDVSYINVSGTFYYLCSILDGFTRSVVHWDLRESMREQDVEIILEHARERYPQARPRIITDNGPQFIAKDFKEYIRFAGMTHVRTSPYYPQSNGKIERWHHSLKTECIRPRTPLSLADARRLIAEYVVHYNDVRLHSAIDYVTPKDKLGGRAQEILHERDRKLQQARERRRQKRQVQHDRTLLSRHPESLTHEGRISISG